MIDFIVYTTNDSEIKIYDYTVNSPISVNEKIDLWKIVISSDRMNTEVQLDVLDYLHNNRVENELFTITPKTLNQERFKDGLYKVDMVIDNEIKTHYVILYNVIYNKFRSLLEKYNYTFTVSELGYINYVDDESSYKTEDIRLISGLINQLQTYRFQSYNDTVQLEINDIIDKAERIAEILETN